MVVWLKPCESRSSPGFTQKPRCSRNGVFSLCVSRPRVADRWSATRCNGVACTWNIPAEQRAALPVEPTVGRLHVATALRCTWDTPAEQRSTLRVEPTVGRLHVVATSTRRYGARGMRLPSMARLYRTLRISHEDIRAADQRSALPEGVAVKPTNGRLHPRRCHRAADQRSALPQGHGQTKTAPSRAPFCCVTSCPRDARAKRDEVLRPRRQRHAVPALSAAWSVHAGTPQPLRPARRPALPADVRRRWPLRPMPRSAGWHRPSARQSG